MFNLHKFAIVLRVNRLSIHQRKRLLLHLVGKVLISLMAKLLFDLD